MTQVEVRTPEAAQYYGAPIGSTYITTENLLPEGKRDILAEARGAVPDEVYTTYLHTAEAREKEWMVAARRSRAQTVAAFDQALNEYRHVLEFRAVLAERALDASNARAEHVRSLKGLDAVKEKVKALALRPDLLDAKDAQTLADALDWLERIDS